MAIKRIITDEERARRSEGAKRAKARLKADPIAYQQFRERTSAAVQKQWDEQDQSRRIVNIGKAVKAAAQSLTPAERKVKFGWMNNPNVTAERKREIWKNSLKKWYDTAPQEEIAAMIVRRGEAIDAAVIKTGLLFDANLPIEHETNVWALSLAKFIDFDELMEIA